MKINSTERLLEAVEKESAFRKKELTYLKFRVEQSKEAEVKYEIRTAVMMLYAHWEGSIKNISQNYLRLVSSQNLSFAELSENFSVLRSRKILKPLMSSGAKKYSVFEELYHDLSAINEETINKKFYEGVINTKNNLNYEVLTDIFNTIGYVGNRRLFEVDKALIDQKLLGTRNGIAHGELYADAEPRLDATQYCLLHQKICKLIEQFKNDVLDMALNRTYLRAAA